MMKSRWKQILSGLILLLLALTLAGCGNRTVYETEQQTELQLEAGAVSMMTEIVGYSEEEMAALIDEYEYEQDVVMANGLNSWKSSRRDLGNLTGVNGTRLTRGKDGSYHLRVDAQFEQRDCEFILTLDRRMQKITELTFNPVYTLQEKLRQAGINLVIGMGTVLAVLIFLTWIISLFKYVSPDARAARKKELEAKEAVNEPVNAAAAETVQAAESTQAAKELELQLVIAAAVSAYEDGSGK